MKITRLIENIKNSLIKILYDYSIKILYDYLISDYIQRCHRKNIKRIQKKWGKEKITVGFLVNDDCKWQYQSLYDELVENESFTPLVFICGGHCDYLDFQKTYAFFKKKGMNVEIIDNLHKPRKYGVDIFFYQQPWGFIGFRMKFNLLYSSASSLSCYVSYGLHLVDYSKKLIAENYTKRFHALLWMMFVEDESFIPLFSKYANQKITNCRTVNHSRLDDYFTTNGSTIAKGNKKCVIYAPHHSFGADSLDCATFKQNGKFILELAQKYKNEVMWVFKPHPRFKFALVNGGIMTKSEADDYFNAWNELGIVYDTGGYFDLFMQSDALITDSISFLAEYLPSQHPILHIKKNDAIFNEFANSFINSYYTIKSNDSLEHYFEKVIINGNDYKKEERLSKISLLFDSKEKASSKIIRILTSSLKI